MKLLAFFVSLVLSLVSSLYVVICMSFIFVENMVQHTTIMSFLLGFTDILPSISRTELIHMQDVRALFLLSFIIWLVSLVFWLLLKREKLNNFPLKYIYPLIVALALIGVFFDQAFILFHQIFFTNAYWIFPATSWIIQLYPTAFFVIAASIWFGCAGCIFWLLRK
jgi:integral membrane protein (TIGR01906 family)